MSAKEKDPKTVKKKAVAKKAVSKKAVSKKAVSNKAPAKVAKKVATTKKVTKKVASKVAPKKGPLTATRISYPEYRERVAVAAYYIAEKRLFEQGVPDQDWVQAEAEVKAALAAAGIDIEPA